MAELPIGIQRVLVRAAQDDAFRRSLLERRSRAAMDAGFTLTESERAVLDVAPVDQMEAMIASLPPELWEQAAEPPEERLVTLGIAPDMPEVVRGSRPDRPAEVVMAPAGIRPDMPKRRWWWPFGRS